VEEVVLMENHDAPREVQEIVLVQTEHASFEGSGYDAGLSLDTTPASRVDWPAAGPPPEQRSAYDAKMIADTTPTSRPEPAEHPSTGAGGSPDASHGR